MAPKTTSVGGLLASYLSFCVLVGAVWVGLAQRHLNRSEARPDLEAIVGGMIIFGSALALWFTTEAPVIDLGPWGDGVEGFTLGVVVGFVVTGLSLALRVWNEKTTEI